MLTAKWSGMALRAIKMPGSLAPPQLPPHEQAKLHLTVARGLAAAYTLFSKTAGTFGERNAFKKDLVRSDSLRFSICMVSACELTSDATLLLQSFHQFLCRSMRRCAGINATASSNQLQA